MRASATAANIAGAGIAVAGAGDTIGFVSLRRAGAVTGTGRSVLTISLWQALGARGTGTGVGMDTGIR